MPEVYYNDPAGHHLRSYDYNGFLVPPFDNVQDRLDKLRSMTLRNDDVLLISYMKSGCHWVWEISGMLLRGCAEYDSNAKDVSMLELSDQEDFNLLSSPRVLNSHILLEHLPQDLVVKKNKIIYVTRNPRDVYVSSYHHLYQMRKMYHYDGDWNGYFELCLDGKVNYGKWFDYMLQWEKDIKANPDLPVLIIKYEQIKKDPVGSVAILADFLGVPKNEKLFEEIADKCTFAKMKIAKTSETDEFRTPGASLFRKGKVGDWKNWFTVQQNERFEEECRKFNDKTELFGTD